MIRLLLLVVPLAVLAGCKTENPAYCGDLANAGMQGCPGDATNGGGCGSDGECTMQGFPVCVKANEQGTCKQCSDGNKGACSGTTPRCESNACVACVDDMDCPGSVCLATGGCADASRIIHARSGSNQTSNCGESITNACSLSGAITLAGTTSKNVIKLDDAGPFGQSGFTVSADMTIDARGATLTRGDNGPVLTVMGGKTLTLLGGTIRGTATKMNTGILCNGTATTLIVDQTIITANSQFGIDASSCALTVTRAKIEGNGSTGVRVNDGSITLARTWLDTNNGGGIDIHGSAQFTIAGNIIVNNGAPNGIIGGISVVTTTSNNRLEFNSLAENKAQDTVTVAAGILCTNAGLVARNNIVWNNNSAVANMAGIQVLGCAYSYSDIGPAPVTGSSNMGNNQNTDPKFKDNTTDLHLTSMSPLQMLQADPGSSLTDITAKDIDGEPRVAPVNVGADQYTAPAKPDVEPTGASNGNQ